MPRAESSELPDPVGRREPRDHYRGESGESDRDRRDGGGLNDEQHRPAVEKAPDFAERFAEIDVLATSFWHSGSEFSIAERSDERHYARSDPDSEEKRGAFYLVRDICGDDENAGADHRSGDDH